MPARRSMRWLWWLAAAGAAVVVLVVGGTFAYIHFIEGPAPAPLGFSTPAASPAGTTATSLAGAWRVAAGSQAGYRVKEVLLGQNNVAVGRTSHIAGNLVIKGSTVQAARRSRPAARSRSPDRCR